MGYDTTITRRDTWSADEGPAITRAEWQAILASDVELERVDEEDTARMLDPSRHVARFFWYQPDGRIFVKKPNRPVLMKMLAIAEKLGARVIGDDDEVYSRDGVPDKPAPFTITDRW